MRTGPFLVVAGQAPIAVKFANSIIPRRLHPRAICHPRGLPGFIYCLSNKFIDARGVLLSVDAFAEASRVNLIEAIEHIRKAFPDLPILVFRIGGMGSHDYNAILEKGINGVYVGENPTSDEFSDWLLEALAKPTHLVYKEKKRAIYRLCSPAYLVEALPAEVPVEDKEPSSKNNHKLAVKRKNVWENPAKKNVREARNAPVTIAKIIPTSSLVDVINPFQTLPLKEDAQVRVCEIAGKIILSQSAKNVRASHVEFLSFEFDISRSLARAFQIVGESNGAPVPISELSKELGLTEEGVMKKMHRLKKELKGISQELSDLIVCQRGDGYRLIIPEQK